MPNKLPLSFAFVLLALLATAPLTGQDTKPAKKPPAPDKRTLPQGPSDRRWPDFEGGVLSGRVQDYLRRHGDGNGKIDAEDLLRRTREFLEQPPLLAIGGSAWSSIGPTNGAGRATAIAINPSSGLGATPTVLIGAAGGGVWKTTDGGANWSPLTDGIPNLSIGAVAYAPSNTSIVYVGTGEGGYALDFVPGIGLLVSSDGGSTWTLPSSVLATKFYRISVNPTNASDLVVGTNAGGKRSTSGQNGPWTTVISSSTYGDVTDLVRDPTNPQILYAATWGGSAGSTILRSTDGGSTWTPKNSGIPANFERMSIAIAPSNPQILYAAVELQSGNDYVSHVYKTINSGTSWSETSLSSNADSSISDYMHGQGWYNNALVVSPSDANVVTVGGTFFARTTDGGATWNTPAGWWEGGVHVDHHDLRYDRNGQLWIANDGGIWTDNAGTVTDRNTGLVTRQFYAMAIDPSQRNRTVGGTQDNGTSQRPPAGGTVWDFITGADGFQCLINGENPFVGYTTIQYGNIYRTLDGYSAPYPPFERITPPFNGTEPQPFFTLLAGDTVNTATVYAATDRLWKSTTAGDSWIPLPTTTTDGSSWNSGISITAIAISRSNPQVLMVASAGQVFRSTNGGTSWVRASSGLPGDWITCIEIDPTNANTAYVTLSKSSGPSVYYTTTGGTSWSSRASGLPAFPSQVIRVDPTDSLTLYCGTDVGVYRSTNSGANWSRFGTGLPAVAVYDIQYVRDGGVLRAATHGRGMWELAVTGNPNRQPKVTIGWPPGPITISANSALTLSGTFSDPDGDAVTASWLFPDLWTKTSATSGASMSRVFPVAGTFPVTLTAVDSHGASASATATVTVTPAGDACASPVVIPGAGPFPYTVTFSDRSATVENSDSFTCGISPYQTVWLSFTPTVSGTYYFSLCGGKASVALEAYTGNACGPYTSMGFCTAESPQPDCSAGGSYSLSLTANQTIRLLMGSYYDDGPIDLTIARGIVSTQTVVASIAPSGGSTSGGTSIVVNGANFFSGATVTLGGVAATNVSLIDSKTISATAPAHAAGSVDVAVRNSSGATGTLGKGFNYLASPLVTTGANFYLITPCRLIDTRNANGPFGGPPLASGERRNFVVAGNCGIAADAKSIVANIVAIQGTSTGWVIAYPGPAGSDLPFVSSLNYTAGTTRANNGVVQLGPNGSINIFNSGPDAINIVLDLSGYFK